MVSGEQGKIGKCMGNSLQADFCTCCMCGQPPTIPYVMHWRKWRFSFSSHRTRAFLKGLGKHNSKMLHMDVRGALGLVLWNLLCDWAESYHLGYKKCSFPTLASQANFLPVIKRRNLGEEPSPKIQPEALLTQFQAISSNPVTEPLREGISFCPFSAPHQGVVTAMRSQSPPDWTDQDIKRRALCIRTNHNKSGQVESV